MEEICLNVFLRNHKKEMLVFFKILLIEASGLVSMPRSVFGSANPSEGG